MITPPQLSRSSAVWMSGLRDILRASLPAVAIWVVLTVAIFLVGGVYIDRIRSETVRAALSRASVGAQAIEQVLLRSADAIGDIHALVQIRTTLLIKGDREGASAITEHLGEIASAEQFGVVQIKTIDAYGWSTWTTSPDGKPVWLGDLEYFTIHRDGGRGLLISRPVFNGPLGRWTVEFSRPLISPDGAFNGVAVVSYDRLLLSKALARLQFGRNGVSSVWSSPEGRLIASSDKMLDQPADPNLLSLLAARKTSTGKEQLETTIDGRLSLQAFRMIGDLPLVANVSLDRNVELKNANMNADRVNLTCVGLSLLTGALQTLVAILSMRRRSRLEFTLARQEADLAASAQSRIALLLSGLPAAIYAARIRRDGTAVDFTMTETAHRLTGWELRDIATLDQWTGKTLGMNAEDWQNYYKNISADGDAHIEYKFLHRDGSIIWLRDEARAVAHPGEHEVSVVGYVSDITRERNMRAQTLASSKLATLGEMATGLAHELNQPIATMSLAAENAAHMLTSKGSEGISFALKRMGRIVEQAARARTIIDHLRIFGRHNQDEVGPVDLRAVVEGAMHMVGNTLKTASIDIEIALADDLPRILAEPVLAEHVLVNLLLNARDSMEANPPDKPRKITIRGKLDDDGRTVSLSIQDNGTGIPEAIQNRIFEPFFTTKDVGKGSGLGLSLCHGIMTSFGGTIIGCNVRSGGAMFIATFRCLAN